METIDPFAPVNKDVCLASAHTCLGDLEAEFLTTYACGEEGAPC